MSENRKSIKNTYINFGAMTIFCIVFAFIYELNSHNVYSNSMIFAFLYPLLLGGVPFFIFYKKKRVYIPNDFSRLSYCFGVVTLMVGSIYKGILFIYGTTNRLLKIYYIVGCVFLFTGLGNWCYNIIKSKKGGQ